MRFTEEPRYEFYPDIDGNLNLPQADRLAVEIIRPTGYTSGDFTRIESTREFYPDDQPVDSNGEARTVVKFKSVSTKISYDVNYILCNCVGYVKNCVVDRVIDASGTTKEIAITTGKELADSRAYGLRKYIDAIIAEVASDKITESKKKNYV